MAFGGFEYAREEAINDAIISRISPRAAAPNRGDADDYWYGGYIAPSSSGVNVTAESAMRLAAAYRCVHFLAKTIGKLPLHMYRKRGDGSREESSDHPLNDVLQKRPNRWQTRMDFFSTIQAYTSMRGNGIAQIISGPTRAIDQLLPIHPDRVTISRLSDGGLGYGVTQPDGTKKTLTQDEVFHVRGLSLDGIRGLNPIEYARDTFGIGIAAEQFAARFYVNDATPGGVLEHPGELKGDGLANLKRSWREAHGTVLNAHGIAVLEEGMKYKQIGISNRDAQFLESRKFSVTDICRIFGVPPHIAYDLDRSTNNNIEHQGMEVVIYTLTELMEAIEQSIQRDLIDPLEPVYGPGYYAEFSADGLLRGDLASRMTAYVQAVQNGIYNRNECRALENRNPYDGGDEFYHPANITPDSASPQDAVAPGKAIPGRAQPPSPPNDSEDSTDDAAAQLVTIRVRRDLAIALNGRAHPAEAAA